jgi:modification methylase
VTEKIPEGTQHDASGKGKLLGSVWDFGAISPVVERKHYLCNDHPAKMKPTLAKAILQVYGESPVLDPMAGIGTTLVEAMLLGMDAVGIEYEKKFADEANMNIEHVRKSFCEVRLGNTVCLHGDARKLDCISHPSSLFNFILFSPPYGEQHGKGGSIFNADGTVTEKFRSKFASSKIRRKGFLDTSSPNNIDNVRHGPAYLCEMLKVYSECYRVLASGKLMAVVVRDIRRNSLTVPVAADTIGLCRQAGFELFDIIISKTYLPSFWMLNRATKDQASGIMHPLRNHEYVLVFRKPCNV